MSYKFNGSFERKLVVALCERPRLYESFGADIDRKKIDDPTCALTLLFAQEIARELGRGPSDSALVLQRAREAEACSDITEAELHSIEELLVSTDASKITDQEFTALVVPSLQAALGEQIANRAVEAFASRGSFQGVERLLQKRSTIGLVTGTTGTRLGRPALAEIAALRHLEKLPTGIMELDLGLSGGLSRGAMGLFMAPSGHGKSMFLNHVSGIALLGGLTVAYATLELPVEEIIARQVAFQTLIPTNAVKDPAMIQEVEKAFDNLPPLGPFYSKRFPAGRTTPQQVFDWFDDVAQKEGRQVDLRVIDYVEKMIPTGTQNSNLSSEFLHETFRTNGEDARVFTWTASQVARRKGQDRKKRIENEDVAGYIGKINVVDLAISGFLDDQAALVNLFVAKNRYGRFSFPLGPYPIAHDCGRYVA